MTDETTRQLDLLPEKPLTLTFKRLTVAEIVGDKEPQFIGPEPKLSFIRSVKMFGVIQPIVVTKTAAGFRVAAGRRRLRAVMELAIEEPDNKQWVTIPAQIAKDAGEAQRLIDLIENEHRGDNAAVTLGVLEQMVDRGYSENEMVQALGIPVQRVRRLLRLTALHPVLRSAFDADKISPDVAERTAKLPNGMQEKLAAIFEEKGVLSMVAIKEARQARRADAVAEAEESNLFGEEATSDEPKRATWRDILADKIDECIALAHQYNEALVEAHLKDAVDQLRGAVTA